jgi:hypothetical protein
VAIWSAMGRENPKRCCQPQGLKTWVRNHIWLVHPGPFKFKIIVFW